MPRRCAILAGVPVAEPAVIRLREARINALVGAPIPLPEVKKFLGDLGFQVSPGADAHTLDVATPSFRPDIGGEADLIEEIVRVRGLDVVPTHLTAIRPQAPRATLVLENKRHAAVVASVKERFGAVLRAWNHAAAIARLSGEVRRSTRSAMMARPLLLRRSPHGTSQPARAGSSQRPLSPLRRDAALLSGLPGRTCGHVGRQPPR
jgi:hypothetical protein